MKHIVVEKGEKKRIAEVFEVSHVTIRRALNYETKSVIAEKIRAYALNNRGKIYDQIK